MDPPLWTEGKKEPGLDACRCFRQCARFGTLVVAAESSSQPATAKPYTNVGRWVLARLAN